MERIHPNLLSLPTGGGKAAETPRSIVNSDRAPDFHEEFRREVNRSLADVGRRNGVTSRDTTRPAERNAPNEGHADAEHGSGEARADRASLDEAGKKVSTREEETVSTDEAEFSEAATGAESKEVDEQDPAEVGPQEIPAELQVAATLPVPGQTADLVEASESALADEPTENQLSARPDKPISPEGSVTETRAEEPAAGVTEATLPAVASHLHRSSKARGLAGSDEDSRLTESVGSEAGSIEITEALASKVAAAGDSLLDRNSQQQAASEAENRLQTSTDELNLATQAAEGEPALELAENSSPESSSRETRTTPVGAAQRGASDSLQHSARSTPDEPRSPQVDPSRFVSRVSRAFEAANQRGGTVQLRLSPPELGAMRVELSVQQGVLSARLETETAAAKSLLIDNLPALRERLAALDIRVERFDVDVRQESTGGQPDWQAQQESRDRQQGRSAAGFNHAPRSATRDSPSEVTRPGSPFDATGRFNAVA